MSRNITLQSDSRYVNTAVLQDVSLTFFDVWRAPSILPSDSDTFYTIQDADRGRFDLLATRYYGNPSLWWVIAFVNNLPDTFNVAVGTVIRVPPKESVFSALLPGL